MRILVVALAAALLLGGVGAAGTILVPSIPEQLVEGHTVWATIEIAANGTQVVDFAAAVAVLVQDRYDEYYDARFPGVLWFNDQYLVGPDQPSRDDLGDPRYPCTGAVIAVNAGDPVDRDVEGRWTLTDARYANESYLITDPNDQTWNVDLWTTAWGTYAWTVALRGTDATGSTPDDGEQSCPSYTERGFPRGSKSPGDHDMGYPCDGCDALRYNAVLYMRLVHLTAWNGTKDHREQVGVDWWQDASGCSESTISEYPCPDGDDAREGNSHPYAPDRPFPAQRYDGEADHGRSAECPVSTGVALDECHARFDIDVYYGYVAPPAVRQYVVVDLDGSEAPYHCHDDSAPCDWDELTGQG